jgi:steroid delta-isomerase-like uncharacterized protein
MTTGEILLKALDAVNRHDAAALAALYASDAVVYDPQYQEPLRGRDAIQRDMEEFFRAFPDVHCELQGEPLVAGSDAAMRLHMTGTNQGPLTMPQGEQSATGRPVDLDIAIFCHMGQGDIIEAEHRYFDMARLLAQLGLLQAP